MRTVEAVTPRSQAILLYLFACEVLQHVLLLLSREAVT